MLTVVAALLLCSADRATAFLSRLDAALGPHDFVLHVAEGGAATLRSATTGELLSTVSSSFSEPGPVWNDFGTLQPPNGSWTVNVDTSRASEGFWAAKGVGKAFEVLRTFALDPRPPARPRRVLVNDTVRTLGPPTSATSSPSAADLVGIHVKHTATVAATEAEVDTAVVPGAYGNWYCSTYDNPGDDCAAPCPDPDVLMTNNGRPDVFANRSSGFAVGLTALDDVFRVQAQTQQHAMKTGPRMAYMGMACEVSNPPSISLEDPMLALRKGGDSYTMEWAIYPMTGNATDYYSFVNSQRECRFSFSVSCGANQAVELA